jgi:pimeloyl-ACP methyl ester carboxylesterase
VFFLFYRWNKPLFPVAMIKLTLATVLIALTAYLGLGLVLYTLQRAMLYYPTLPVHSQEAEEIWITNQGLRLKGWHIMGSNNKTIVYFGGNAEDVALNIPSFKHMFPGYSIYLHNYRGYGGSQGKPTEEGLFSDALAIYDHLKNTSSNITVMGRSLGTGVAVYLASKRTVSNLILVTPFDSMTSVASGLYPFFPVAMLLRDRYDSLSRADQLTMPILIVTAENDEVIPRRNTDNLVSALQQKNTTIQVIPGTGHNTIGTSHLYEKVLVDFLSHPARPALPQ